jgi:uncharacterized membrane protein
MPRALRWPLGNWNRRTHEGAAWNAAGWLYIALLGVMMFRCEIDGIRQQASLEEESRSAILILTILASAAMMLLSGPSSRA